MRVRSGAALRPAIQQVLKSLVCKFSWASLQKYGSLCMWQNDETEKGSSVSGAVVREKTTLRRLVWKLYIKLENHSLSSLSLINRRASTRALSHPPKHSSLVFTLNHHFMIHVFGSPSYSLNFTQYGSIIFRMLEEHNPSKQQGFAVVICKPTGCCVL